MQSDLWRRYWESGAVHSSTMEFSPEARERIAGRWQRIFADLPSGSSILDLGSGAGALLALAAETSNADHRLAATGADLSASRPADAPRSTEHCSIEYRGEIEFANLPFEDRSFDLVVSQFAVEYGDLTAALREAARVARVGFTGLVHAADGVVVQQNAPIAGQIDWLLSELRLVEVLTHHVQKPTRPSANQLKAIAGEIQAAGRRLANPSFLEGIAQNVGQFLMQLGENPVKENIRLLRDFERALRNQADRMHALAVAGRRPEDLDRACATLLDAGFAEAHWKAQHVNDGRHLVGYWLTARGRK